MSFTIRHDGTVDSNLHFRFTASLNYAVPVITNRLLVALGCDTTEWPFSVVMVIADYESQRAVTVHTSIPFTVSTESGCSKYLDNLKNVTLQPSRVLDHFVTEDNDVILYGSDQRMLTIYAYYDVTNLLPTREEMDPQNIPHITYTHDAHLLIPFEENHRFDSMTRFHAIHPWNTPNIRTENCVASVTGVHGPSDDGDIEYKMVTIQWLDVNTLVRLVHQRKVDEDFVISSRRFYCLPKPPLTQAEGSDLLITGTCGKHMVYIIGDEVDAEDEDEGPSLPHAQPWLGLLTFPFVREFAEGDMLDLQARSTRLDVPVNFRTVNLIDFSDECGMLALIRRSETPDIEAGETEGDPPALESDEIVLFQY